MSHSLAPTKCRSWTLKFCLLWKVDQHSPTNQWQLIQNRHNKSFLFIYTAYMGQLGFYVVLGLTCYAILEHTILQTSERTWPKSWLNIGPSGTLEVTIITSGTVCTRAPMPRMSSGKRTVRGVNVYLFVVWKGEIFLWIVYNLEGRRYRLGVDSNWLWTYMLNRGWGWFSCNIPSYCVNWAGQLLKEWLW
jgi:hypothetical protein